MNDKFLTALMNELNEIKALLKVIAKVQNQSNKEKIEAGNE